MPFADTKQGSNTYLRLIWLALQAGGGGGGTAANVGVLSSASLRINPSTLELQQALLGAQFLPTVWQGTGGTYSTDQYLLQKNVSVTATPDYRWWLVDADGSMSQITGDVAIADRQLAGGSSSQASTTATPYQIDGTGPVLYGTLSADRTQIESIPPGTTTTIGTGAGEAQLTGSDATSSTVEIAFNTITTTPIIIAANTVTGLSISVQAGTAEITFNTSTIPLSSVSPGINFWEPVTNGALIRHDITITPIANFTGYLTEVRV